MKGTEISKAVRRLVYERDSYDGCACCIYCGRPYPQIHHYVERSRGGPGTPENLVCLCFECHQKLHNGNDKIKNYCRDYLINLYGGNYE